MNFRDYSPEALREISRRAGLASGKARRRKRKAIEREKVRNIALREQEERNRQQQHENIRMLHKAIHMMLLAKRATERSWR